MRRRILNLAVPFLVLAITLSFVAVLPVTSQNANTIISKLEELRNETQALPDNAFKKPETAQQSRQALINKINALINQIEAGAYQGALNKLEEDIEEKIDDWVREPWEDLLNEKVEDIAELIEQMLHQRHRDFTLSASPPSLKIQQGGYNTSIIMITSLKHFDERVDLTVTSPSIARVTTTLYPSEVTPPEGGFAISLLTVDVATTAQPGNYTITVTGTSEKKHCLLQHSIDITLEIVSPPVPQIPDFAIFAFPWTSLEVRQGGSNATMIVVTSLRGFHQSVDLAVVSAPITGVTVALNPLQVPPPTGGFVTSRLTVNVANTATVGAYTIGVNGTSGTLQHRVNIALKITALEKDTTSPTIASVLRSPETPAYNESVTVTAFVFDVGGGVKQVILNYSSGSAWTTVDMTFNDGLYNASIPAFPFDTSVQYRVHALDNNNNLKTSDPFNYKVIDPFGPVLRIDRPAQGSYLSGTVPITVFTKDQNSGGESGLGSAELFINGTVVPLTPSEPDTYTYSWNTSTFGPDGVYIVKLKVSDKAGNDAPEKTLTVTVDNTLPIAVINVPAAGSYLRLSVLIKVTGSDTNFDKMEVRIDDELARTSLTSGTEVLEWNTRSHGEGVHSITLTVYDKAGNRKQALVNVTTDNTPPLIGTPSWSPKEPAANVDIQVNVTVTEPSFGSGAKNVTLWFKNTTMSDYKSIPMELKDGNWTTILKDQSDTKVRFFIEAFDKAGNKAETETRFEFTVAGPAGFPLIWILIIIAIILAGSGGAAYYLNRKRKKSAGSSSVPTASSKPTPPPEPVSLPVKKPLRRRSQREFQQLMGTLVSSKNAPKVDYSKYINA